MHIAKMSRPFQHLRSRKTHAIAVPVPNPKPPAKLVPMCLANLCLFLGGISGGAEAEGGGGVVVDGAPII